MDILSKNLPDLHSHPALAAHCCLNRLQRRTPCTRCAEICPHGVFPLRPGEAVNWKRCTDCALCLAACPTRALLPSEPVRRSLSELTSGRSPLRITCRQEEEAGDLRLGCLAAVPWELTAALALRGEVYFYTRACAACPHAKQKAQLAHQLAALRDFLGEERFVKQVRLIDSAEAAPAVPEEADENRVVTRRALFSGLKHRAERQLMKEAEKRLPLLLGEAEEPLAFRRLLSEAVKADRTRNPEARYEVKLPRYNLNCFGCGICVAVCPHKALSIVREEGGTRLVFIEPQKCTACGLCVGLCPHKGLDGLETVKVPHLEKLPLVRVKSESCESCGAVLLPGTEPKLCRRCAAEAKKTAK